MIRFSGEVYAWMGELQQLLSDADAIEDVATIGIELLFQSRGKQIMVGQGKDAMVFDLWR
jgi:hypothetical protein